MALQKLIHLSQGPLPYVLEFKRRKTIGIYIQYHCVIVRAPYSTQTSTIEHFLREKEDWILEKYSQQKKRLPQIVWSNGCTLSYLGEMLTIKTNLQTSQTILVDVHTLEVGLLKQSKKQGDLPQIVQNWMKEKALTLLQEKCISYSQQLGVHPKEIKLTSAKTRWGSANSQACIRLHWRLIQLPHELIDYVVVHELAHLKEMNHSPRFWQQVAHILPDYKRRRALLKKVLLPLWSS